MKKPLLVLSLSVVVAAAPLHAMTEESNASADDVAAEEAVEEDPSQRVRCRNQRVTGSNARRIRVCMTIAEWSELARNGNRDARRVLDDAQRDSTQRN
ncbi:hypothetical protein [Parasphingopyxis lamellibrachiae]|uniref:UrcA family protein n=1 Tax=Parasphingopyxis lamellibrachiae TaxID=680125 RepID=A0A3D9FHI9_9SPHN|nr:hypothetical protein [Parasphingopyxis lamellibrachiae]RED17250.1 hypothetical protein DFR46_2289 [Parasphingopyxis lamellibrachiae]